MVISVPNPVKVHMMNRLSSLVQLMDTLGFLALVDANKKAFASWAASKSGGGALRVPTEDIGDGIYDTVDGLYGSTAEFELLSSKFLVCHLSGLVAFHILQQRTGQIFSAYYSSVSHW